MELEVKNYKKILNFLTIILSYLFLGLGLYINPYRINNIKYSARFTAEILNLPQWTWVLFNYIEHLLGAVFIGIIFFTLSFAFFYILNKIWLKRVWTNKSWIMNISKRSSVVFVFCASIIYEGGIQKFGTATQIPFDLIGTFILFMYLKWAFSPSSESIQKNTLKKYAQIINFLINKHFPLLKNRNIRIKEDAALEFSADAFKLFSYLRIRTHPRLRRYSKNKLTSLFAHELSHLEDWEKMSWFDYYILRDFKNRSRSYRKSEEEKTDKNVIQIGYARELYSQRKSRWIDKNPRYIRHKWMYLSPEEIKVFAKSIGKW